MPATSWDGEVFGPWLHLQAVFHQPVLGLYAMHVCWLQVVTKESITCPIATPDACSTLFRPMYWTGWTVVLRLAWRWNFPHNTLLDFPHSSVFYPLFLTLIGVDPIIYQDPHSLRFQILSLRTHFPPYLRSTKIQPTIKIETTFSISPSTTLWLNPIMSLCYCCSFWLSREHKAKEMML